MLIGIDASRANCARKTGVEWYSYYLIQELKKVPLASGDGFVLYSPSELKGELNDLPAGWQKKILKWPLKYFWTQIRLSLEMIFNPPDVLFVPAHALPIFSRAQGVITLHDIGFIRFPQAYKFWSRIYLKFIYRFAAQWAKKIITPSEFSKKELIDYYKINPAKIEVVYLGYQNKKFYPIRDQEIINQTLNKYKIKKPYLLYIGRLEKKKNILGLIQAFDKISQVDKKINLVLVGQPGCGYDRNIKNQISKIKNIYKVGHIDQKDLVYLYNGAEVFVFPSWYEGFGLPILEAMACGCPVAASNAASIPEVGGEAIEYFNPQRIDEIVEAIEKIISDESQRQDLIRRGLERAKYFSWTKCAQETYQILINI